jgi:sigma-B regulation protein RsbU (phosphoserine phosphatase)
MDQSMSGRQFINYALYNWTREMPARRRLVTMTGLIFQGYAFYALLTRSLVWPIMWPSGPLLYAVAWIVYMLGYFMTNAMLTAEFFRKSQLESDEIAAQKIQRTLQPDALEQPLGYLLEMFNRPFRAVGGDYFDVIDLSENQTLFALADVSGKGTPAALLASNIQALVRSIATTETDPLVLANRLNQHLSQYTPSDRFATGVFIVLNRDSGEIQYVNAGHNAPLLCGPGSTKALEATGVPLGLFAGATYEKRAAKMAPGDILLIYTDGLTDSVAGDSPEERVRAAVTTDPHRSLSNLQALVDPKLNEDDVTVLLAKRLATVPPTWATGNASGR